jgi:GMP synthase-like glutamine amidotransferase
MAIIIFQHTPSDGPGRLGLTLRDHGKQADIRRLDLPEGAPSAGGIGLRNQHIPADFDGVDGVVSLGGGMMVGDSLPWMQPELEFLAEAHNRNVPLVGICLGAQLIAKALGGEVGPMASPPAPSVSEWGMLPVRQHPVANTDIVLAGVPWTTWQFHAHGWEIKTAPPGAQVLQFSDRCKVQSFRAGIRTYAFQYHFECDLPMISDLLNCGSPQIAQAGVDPAAALAAAKDHYEPYARVSDRLCVNLATYLFSVSRAISA